MGNQYNESAGRYRSERHDAIGGEYGLRQPPFFGLHPCSGAHLVYFDDYTIIDKKNPTSQYDAITKEKVCYESYNSSDPPGYRKGCIQLIMRFLKPVPDIRSVMLNLNYGYISLNQEITWDINPCYKNMSAGFYSTVHFAFIKTPLYKNATWGLEKFTWDNSRFLTRWMELDDGEATVDFWNDEDNFDMVSPWGGPSLHGGYTDGSYKDSGNMKYQILSDGTAFWTGKGEYTWLPTVKGKTYYGMFIFFDTRHICGLPWDPETIGVNSCTAQMQIKPQQILATPEEYGVCFGVQTHEQASETETDTNIATVAEEGIGHDWENP